MTQLRSFQPRLRAQRSVILTLLLMLLIGSLFGTLCFRCNEVSIRNDSVLYSLCDPLFISLLRIFALPALMMAAFLMRQRILIRVLFLCKGFSVSLVLSACVSAGGSALKSCLHCLIPETFFLLPALFLVGAVWYQDIRTERIELTPALIILPQAVLTLALERLAFH